MSRTTSEASRNWQGTSVLDAHERGHGGKGLPRQSLENQRVGHREPGSGRRTAVIYAHGSRDLPFVQVPLSTASRPTDDDDCGGSAQDTPRAAQKPTTVHSPASLE